MKTKRRIIVPILLFFIVGIIWLNSSMDAVISDMQSDWVFDLLNPIFEKVFDRTLTVHIVRKLAHFIEFAVLGGVLYLAVSLFDISPSMRIYTSGTLSMIVALIDETIQLTSEGRTSQVTDVWLDCLGSISAIICLAMIFHLAHLDRDDPEEDAADASPDNEDRDKTK
ncbi:MAG: VanZ family protein [Firmicutes bacterium]|nr:VanZ family protein [Bacillota bacterium]